MPSRYDTNELRLIGEWLAEWPIDIYPTAADRVIAAANEIDRLRHVLGIISALGVESTPPPTKIASAEQFEAMVAEAKQAQR